MTQPEPRPPASDDTAAFQRFYGAGSGAGEESPGRGLLYRLFVGWWRDRI